MLRGENLDRSLLEEFQRVVSYSVLVLNLIEMLCHRKNRPFSSELLTLKYILASATSSSAPMSSILKQESRLRVDNCFCSTRWIVDGQPRLAFDSFMRPVFSADS